MFSTTSPDHNGVPTRPPASAHLLMSSTDRYKNPFDRLVAPTTAADFTLSKQYNLLSGYFTRLAITQIQFWWNLPTIISGVNDKFFIIFGTTSLNLIFPEAFYSLEELAAAMEAGIQDHSSYDPAWDVTVTVVDGALKIVSQVQAIIGPDPDDDRFAKFLITAGLGNNVSEDVGDTWELYGAPAPMVYTQFIDMCSRNLTQFQRVKDATTLINNVNDDVIARIYPCPPNVSLNGAQPGQLFAAPFVMTIDYNTPKHMKWSPDQAINNFDIQLKDEYGQIIYWSYLYPTEFQLTMLASET